MAVALKIGKHLIITYSKFLKITNTLKMEIHPRKINFKQCVVIVFRDRQLCAVKLIGPAAQ